MDEMRCRLFPSDHLTLHLHHHHRRRSHHHKQDNQQSPDSHSPHHLHPHTTVQRPVHRPTASSSTASINDSHNMMMTTGSSSCPAPKPRTRSVTLASALLLILTTCLLMPVSTSADCTTDFDAIHCDFTSQSGYGFTGSQKWDLECYGDEINVITGTGRPAPLAPLSSIFSDGEFLFLVRGNQILVTRDKSLDTYEHVMETSEVLAGYNRTIVTAFFFKEQLFVFDGNEFSIFNQRIFRANSAPGWSFRTMSDARRTLSHDKLSGLKTSLVVPVPEQRDSDLILLVRGRKYYKMSLNHCLPQDARVKRLKDMCFWPQGPKKMENLISCVWISWKMLILVLMICLLALLITCYVCCLLICYRRHRKSGTFKHEKQDCCQDGDHFLDDENHAFCKETHKLSPRASDEDLESGVNGRNGGLNLHGHHLPMKGSNGKLNGGTSPSAPVTTATTGPLEPELMDDGSVIIDAFGEDRMSIDLNERTYKQ